MHVIVVGAGEVGSYVAELLTRGGNDVAVIEQDRDKLREVEARLDVLAIHGSGSHPTALRRAGADKADLLVAVSSNDEANLVAALVAKQLGVERTIVRVEAPELRGRDAAAARDAIGVDLVIDPDAEVAEEITHLLTAPGAAEMAMLAGGEVVVIGAILEAGAPLCGRRLSDIAAEYEPDWQFLVAAVTRGGPPSSPAPINSYDPTTICGWWLSARRAATYSPCSGCATTPRDAS